MRGSELPKPGEAWFYGYGHGIVDTKPKRMELPKREGFNALFEEVESEVES
ncbi:hypothetical protein E6C60_1073 [Paenibacillus algicola]|uniref:Uncharacterized protein n=1 Tax=Paenibacillus algicola TaxID=2565926 RepID=A0A4P8XK62_9BACL|nr:hypothetical protein E6C60_1073 [Paenibacillus algicola]